MADSQFIERCLSWAMDKGLAFTFIFISAVVALLNMDILFGYPLDGPHKFVLFLLLLFACIYGHYFLKAIRVWLYITNPRNYGVETCAEVKAIRNTVREIFSGCHSASLDDWQRWDDDFFNVHLSKAERKNEWRELQPIVMATRKLRLAQNFDNKISTDEGAMLKAYEDIETFSPKYLDATSWAQFK